MRAVEKHLCSLRSRAMNWIYENLIARKKVHLACCACYHPHWTTVLCIERKPKQRKKSLCLFSLFRLFSGNLWLPFEDVRSLIGIVLYSIDVPATNLFILLHCDLVGSAHQLSETKQREFSQRERAKLKRYPKSCQKGIEECFSHKTKVSLIIVSCCDQRDHMSVAVPYTAVYIQTPFASEYHLSIQSATIIYLLLFIRFTLSLHYSFDSLGCFVQLWLWLLTIDTKWSFRFLCFLQLSTIEPVPIRIRAQFYVHRETFGSFIEKRPSSSKIIFSLYRIKNIKIVFGRFRLGMFEKLRLFWCVRFFKS